MKKLSLLWLVGVLSLVPAAQAQWQTITYTLRGGWNAIYLQGDATHTTIDNLFAGVPSVISVVGSSVDGEMTWWRVPPMLSTHWPLM